MSVPVFKPKYATYKATVTYKLEVTDDFHPSAGEEAVNMQALMETDPEFVEPRVEVEEL